MAREASLSPPVPRALTWDEIQALLSGGGDRAGDAGDAAPPNICTLYRAIFGLRTAAPSPGLAVGLLTGALRQREAGAQRDSVELPPRFSSVLFRHECCYLLGQIGADAADLDASQQAYACLYDVLRDTGEDEVTRHEAAEGIAAVQGALGGSDGGGPPASGAASETAVGNGEMLQLLERLSQEQSGKGPLAETCFLAVEGLKRNAKKVCACQYASHDPALGDPTAGPEDVERYRKLLESGTADLFQRYVAMFTLRNLGAGEELAAVLASDKTSVVLRHELAFVLGQMENDIATVALARSLAAEEEHVMVRHEAAIALGSIGGETAKAHLREYATNAEPMVAESCQVALDTAAYWEAWEALEARLAAQRDEGEE